MNLIADKQFKPSMAYLGGLINAGNFAGAKELVKYKFFLIDHDIKTYFIGHNNNTNPTN
jgi:hypothetical protein